MTALPARIPAEAIAREMEANPGLGAIQAINRIRQRDFIRRQTREGRGMAK